MRLFNDLIESARTWQKLVKALAFTVTLALVPTTVTHAQNADPLAANNGLYPTAAEWDGPFRIPNYNYPRVAPTSYGAFKSSLGGPVTVATAPQLMAEMKAYLEPTLRGMIDAPKQWQPKDNGWFNMVWSGQGSSGKNGTDPNSGLDSLLASATGQIMPADTFIKDTPKVDVQNHAVTYYNPIAATMLGKLWENIYAPATDNLDFPDGSIVVKTEAATPSWEDWPVLANGSTWNVFRPSVAAQQCAAKPGCTSPPLKSEVLSITAIQMSVALKSKTLSPETGWVFMAFTYNTNAQGTTPWDRFVPLGAQWGNDPQLTGDPSGRGPGGTSPLTETWNNPEAPAFTQDTLGWGERLAGPMDVATRHNVVTVSGKRYQGTNHLRASSCLSCHGAAEFPFTTNLYPSPNKSFPPDGNQFLMYDPGSPEWAQWFQNRPGSEGMSINKSKGVYGVDYDWVIVFALMAYNRAVGNVVFTHDRFDVH